MQNLFLSLVCLFCGLPLLLEAQKAKTQVKENYFIGFYADNTYKVFSESQLDLMTQGNPNKEEIPLYVAAAELKNPKALTNKRQSLKQKESSLKFIGSNSESQAVANFLDDQKEKNLGGTKKSKPMNPSNNAAAGDVPNSEEAQARRADPETPAPPQPVLCKCPDGSYIMGQVDDYGKSNCRAACGLELGNRNELRQTLAKEGIILKN